MARKVEDQMIAAVRAAARGKFTPTKCGNNTSVRHVPEHEQVLVYLHGHLIAEIAYQANVVEHMRCTLAGYNTPTTRSRINALARAFAEKGVGVRCLKGEARVTTASLRAGEMHERALVSAREWFTLL